MKCIKCKTNNITKANYCKNCAYNFSEKEQKIARRKTLIGKLEWIEDIYEVCSLKVITNHILFKVFSIVLILSFGVYLWLSNGLSLKLLNNDNYKIQYNKSQDEYYVISTQNKIPIDLYVPERYEKIIIKHFDENNNMIESHDFLKTDIITLESNDNGYYILEAVYKEKSEQLKIFAYLEKDIEV